MPEDGSYFVTEPLGFAFDAEGNIEITIVSRNRTFVFTASRHKCRNANMAMRRMLDLADREQSDRVRTFKKVKGSETGHG